MFNDQPNPGSLPPGADTEAAIQQLERETGIALPPEIREALLHPVTIDPKRNRFMRVVDADFSQEMSLHAMQTPVEMLIGWRNLRDDQWFSPHPIIAFGETLGSPVICVGTGQENYGAIYVFCWDFELTKQAPSFSAFLQSLY